MKKRFSKGCSMPTPGEVHIHILRPEKWEFRSPSRDALAHLRPEEVIQGGTFHLEKRRREFFWSRLFLRSVLAIYLQKEPQKLQFQQQKNGKPYLEDDSIEFNLSHTDGLIACSVGSRRIGIDVEKVSAKGNGLDWESLARRFLSEEETQYLFSQEPRYQKDCFFWIFTLKEAVVKAQGKGLSFPFQRFSVPLPPNGKQAGDPWDYVSRYFPTDEVYLAHVVENPTGVSWVYRFWEWDEGALYGFLNGNEGTGIVGFKPMDFDGIDPNQKIFGGKFS